MRVLKVIILAASFIVLLFASFLFYISITDFKPQEKETLSISNNQLKEMPVGENISITTYNIGYAGLDKTQDFFADGGERSRAESTESVQANIDAVIDALDITEAEILLLQEVDQNSSRSHRIDQVELLKTYYPNYGYSFGINYKVPWVPVPLLNPMGKALSGVMTLSRYNITDANRFQLPGEEKWPVRLFELDRCFTESRLKATNGKEVVLINLHLSAFDEGGIIRLQQLEYLKKHLEVEYEKGNYLIAGGDWNHNLPGTDPMTFESSEPWPFWLKNLPDDYHVKTYYWAVDSRVPTVRTLEKPYQDGYNFKAVIDGFLVSDNIEIISVNNVDTDFENTDHNPVNMIFSLK
ncbi:endonuclease/exonuclease/phosphatase family protein [Gudongella sp. DL1XJH-153]|uniref:endonuclease/exonuclease/phosphatase family protein n=1 Tax=Gudongella sp. DL1XJH-153 TaxID=3409804 RepID=UPI003BB7D9A3